MAHKGSCSHGAHACVYLYSFRIAPDWLSKV